MKIAVAFCLGLALLGSAAHASSVTCSLKNDGGENLITPETFTVTGNLNKVEVAHHESTTFRVSVKGEQVEVTVEDKGNPPYFGSFTRSASNYSKATVRTVLNEDEIRVHFQCVLEK